MQQSVIVLKNGKIVNDDLMFDCDILVTEGVIKSIGKELKAPENAIILDCKGKFVIPGGIDPNTHFEASWNDIESVDDFYDGSRAALAGGVTMIIDCAIKATSKSLTNTFKEWKKKADSKVCCDYSLHVAIPKWDDNVAQDMTNLAKESGVNSFMLYMAYKGLYQMSDPDLYKTMDHIRKIGALAMVHCENGDIKQLNAGKLVEQGLKGPEGCLLCSPEEIEGEAVHRAIVIAGQVNCPLYIIHVMSKTAASIIAKSRQKGHVVYGEANAAALGTDGTNYFNASWSHAAAHITSPPLRPDPSTPPTLMNHLANGDLQLCASDNRTFSTAQRKSLFDKGGDFRVLPEGVNGVEHWMSVLWEKGVVSGKMDPCRFVAVSSTDAAKIFNLYPRKGRIQVGADADIVVWDPHVTRTITAATHHQKVDFNVFEGMEIHGAPCYVISRGRLAAQLPSEPGVKDFNQEGKEIVINDDVIPAGSGRFIHTSPFSQFIYPKIQMRSKLNRAHNVPRYNEHEHVDGGSTDSKQLKSKKVQENMDIND
ncbi:dihydropyrimidinase-like isoform X2 [Gordionus sp. m RMFG-2023]